MRRADHVAPSIHKSWQSLRRQAAGRSVGIVRSRTQTMEFSFLVLDSASCCVHNQGCRKYRPHNNFCIVRVIICYCHYMFRSLFDHLQAEYTIFVLGNYYTNISIVLESTFMHDNYTAV
jgi:hypothetical protein